MNWHLLENLKTLRFGPGALSKNLWALGFLLAVFAVTILATHNDELRVLILGLSLFAYLLYHGMNLLTMKLHPQLALLEGVELLDYYRSSQGVMGKPELADVPGIENPGERPKLTSGGDGLP